MTTSLGELLKQQLGLADDKTQQVMLGMITSQNGAHFFDLSKLQDTVQSIAPEVLNPDPPVPQITEVETKWGTMTVHALPEKLTVSDKMADDLIQRKLEKLGVKTSLFDKYGNLKDGDPYIEQLALALQKGEMLQGDVQYASMLINGLLKSMRQVKNILGSTPGCDVAAQELEKIVNTTKMADEFVRGTEQSRKQWSKKVWLKKNTTKTTLSMHEPKKEYKGLVGYQYVEDVEPCILVKLPQSGSW